MKFKGFILSAAFAALATVTPALAVPVTPAVDLSVSANTKAAFDLGGPNAEQIIVESFTLTSAVNDVTISAEVGNHGQALSTVNSWLTTTIGPAFTINDVIGWDVFYPKTTDETDTLFSGLNLNAGTYYLVMSGGSTTATESEWYGSNGNYSAVQIGGVYLGGTYSQYNTLPQLNDAPVVSESSLNKNLNMNFTVTNAPEPASMGLFIIGGLAAMLVARKKMIA